MDHIFLFLYIACKFFVETLEIRFSPPLSRACWCCCLLSVKWLFWCLSVKSVFSELCCRWSPRLCWPAQDSSHSPSSSQPCLAFGRIPGSWRWELKAFVVFFWAYTQPWPYAQTGLGMLLMASSFSEPLGTSHCPVFILNFLVSPLFVSIIFQLTWSWTIALKCFWQMH